MLWKWLLHNQSTPLNLAILTIIREEIKILEAFLPPQLGNLTQEHLLLRHQLDMVNPMSSVLDEVLLEVDGAFGVFLRSLGEWVVGEVPWFL